MMVLTQHGIILLLNPKFRVILFIYIGEPNFELIQPRQGNACHLSDELCGLGTVWPDALFQ